MRRMAFLLITILGFAGFGQSLTWAATTPNAATAHAARLCHSLIGRAEQELNIPRHLLQAIALTESGRSVTLPAAGPGDAAKAGKTFTAWPWTVMAEGQGRYLPSKAAAIKEVKKLQSKGVTNIDVGCMQVNLHYHGDAFSSLEEAFDPVHNVAYAAMFLSKLREDRHSWTMAVKFYHSSNRERQSYYRKKVFTTWRNLQKEARQARLATNREQSPGWVSRPTRRPLFGDYDEQQRRQQQARVRHLYPETSQ